MGGRAAEELVFREPTTGASSDIDQATKIARAMVTEYGMSAKLGAVRYGTEHGDPFLGRSMGTQADYSHEVAQIIDDEVRKLIEAAHTEAWEILTEYRDVLDILAGELLEKETLHRAELQALFADVKKRPRLTMWDDFGGRIPSDKPPIKTPGELAIERGEEWPKPVPEPAFKAAIAQASREEAARQAHQNGANGNGTNGTPAIGPTQPDYGAPAGWHAPGWPPQGQPPAQQQHPQGYWYPPPHHGSGWHNPNVAGAAPPPNVAAGAAPPPNVAAGAAPPPYPPYQPYPQPGHPAPQAGPPSPHHANEEPGQDNSRPNG
jgi:cell division protease FtsH